MTREILRVKTVRGTVVSVCDNIIAVVCVHLTKTHSHYAPIQITDTLRVPLSPSPSLDLPSETAVESVLLV